MHRELVSRSRWRVLRNLEVACSLMIRIIGRCMLIWIPVIIMIFFKTTKMLSSFSLHSLSRQGHRLSEGDGRSERRWETV
jgi:hypothetical protein